MTHDHVWSINGLLDEDSEDFEIKREFCTIAGCTTERRLNRETKEELEIVPDGFPNDIDGVELELEDVPGGGSVYKLIMRQVAESELFPEINFEPGDVVLDVDAHVGEWSIYLAKRYPFLRIIALEPQPAVCQLLHRNIERNGVYNIEVHNVAVAGEDGTVELRYNLSSNSGGSSCYITGDDGESTIVLAWSLDSIFDRFDIDRLKLLKIDCEGSEYEVLYNFSRLDRVDNLIGEFHENDTLREMGYSGDDLEDHCGQYVPNVDVYTIEMAE